MWLMYSSSITRIISTISVLRVVWKSRSSSQSGCAAARTPATRLCSRRNRTFSAIGPMCACARSPPHANSVSTNSSGTSSNRTGRIARNSSLIRPPSHSAGGNSPPSTIRLFSRPPRKARRQAVTSCRSP
jgi:hypothetical protein